MENPMPQLQLPVENTGLSVDDEDKGSSDTAIPKPGKSSRSLTLSPPAVHSGSAPPSITDKHASYSEPWNKRELES
jgi:hypothetical protein